MRYRRPRQTRSLLRIKIWQRCHLSKDDCPQQSDSQYLLKSSSKRESDESHLLPSYSEHDPIVTYTDFFQEHAPCATADCVCNLQVVRTWRIFATLLQTYAAIVEAILVQVTHIRTHGRNKFPTCLLRSVRRQKDAREIRENVAFFSFLFSLFKKRKRW